jgi:hypothetical protein
MILEHNVAKMTLDLAVALDVIFGFTVSLVDQLTLSTLMWCKEDPWNFNVLQRVNTADYLQAATHRNTL